MQRHFVIDGEAVILGVDGVSDFNALHSGKHNELATSHDAWFSHLPRDQGSMSGASAKQMRRK